MNTWTKCSDQMPPAGEPLLICYETKTVSGRTDRALRVAVWCFGVWVDSTGRLNPYRVTQWMLAPALPIEEDVA
jgi:hypothetical protein